MAVPVSVAAPLIFFASFIAFIVASFYTKWRWNLQFSSHEPPLPQLEFVDETPLIQPPLLPMVGEEAEKQIREGGKKKKRGRKKRTEVGSVMSCNCGEEGTNLPYPFFSYSSAIQRKIKSQFVELAKSDQAKELSMDQVGQFMNCLVDARNELQHKSEIIRRSFKIKKALLVKAERPSFDRLCQQIYKLEVEHKKVQEDVIVYNILQEQLKLSPAYKSILEASTAMKAKDAGNDGIEYSEISFEELLAKEKKDSFWQRNGKLRSMAS